MGIFDPPDRVTPGWAEPPYGDDGYPTAARDLQVGRGGCCGPTAVSMLLAGGGIVWALARAARVVVGA